MRRNGAHQAKSGHHAGRDAAIGAAANQAFGAPVANGVERVAERIRRGSAAIGNGVRAPAQTKGDGNFRRNHAGNRTGNRIGRKALVVPAEPERELRFGEGKSAAARTHQNAGFALLRVG